jgi:DNA-binding LacI/PurR family transcriptional regulator
LILSFEGGTLLKPLPHLPHHRLYVPIDPHKSRPLYQQIADDLRARITSGEIAVGAQLPSHRELVTSYGVSIITINKALSGLVSDGVLYSRVGKGTFVARRHGTGSGHERRLIGFVLRDLSSPYFSLIAQAAEERAEREGFRILFASSSGRLEKEDDQIENFLDIGVSALIIASMSRTYHATDAIRELHRRDFPYVMVSFTQDEDVYLVASDIEKAGYLATRHLVSCGYRVIGCVSDAGGSVAGSLRKRGYAQALTEAGLEARPEFEFEHPYPGEWNDHRSGYEIGRRIAEMQVRPEAVFAFNDLSALGIQAALMDRGLRVPEDVAVIGMDDIKEGVHARVPLSTVRQPTKEIGERAVEVLLGRIAGRRIPNRTILEPELIVRASSARSAALLMRE